MTAKSVAARSLQEAFEALADEDAVAIGGGVAVGLLSNLGMISATSLVSVSGIPEMRGVQREGENLVIGAAMTHGPLAADPGVRAKAPELAGMFGHIGNLRVRAWGTVGGNLALAEPSQDPPVLLAALGAKVEAAGAGGVRRIPVSELSDGPMSTVLKSGELITKVIVPLPAPGERHCNRNFLPRTADDYATVSAAAQVRFDGFRISAARLFCGAVGPVQVSCDRAAALLMGRALGEPGQLEDVISAVRDAVSPVADHKGSADYKREMAGVFVKRALMALGSQAARGGAGGTES